MNGNESHNKGLPKGITWIPDRRQYRVRIYPDGIPTHGGYFDTVEEALAQLVKLREPPSPCPVQAWLLKPLPHAVHRERPKKAHERPPGTLISL